MTAERALSGMRILDLYIYAQPINPGMWRDFAIAIGREDLLADPRCKDAKTRWEHRDELNEIIRAWTSKRTKHEVMAVLGKAGVPCGATRGRFRLPGCPVHLSASEAPTSPSPPPLAGQHTAEVLAEVLGVSTDEVEKLRAQGVLG